MAITMDWLLEIHHIDVGGGEATAIVVRDSSEKIVSRVLIDAGAEGGGSESLKKYIKQYLQVDAANPFDYIIASHYHNDHIDGFWQCKIPFKNYIDAGGYTLKDDKFIPINGVGVKTSANYFEGYKQQVAANVGAYNAKRMKIPFIDNENPVNGPLTIKLGTGTGIELICYCANGVLADGVNVLNGQKASKRRALNPNDLSFVFILEWENFRYFTAGDLSGDKTLKSYYNVEESLIAYLEKLGKLPVTVLKVTHHGSEYSSYPASSDTTKDGFLDKLRPDTLIVPCNISKKVPSPSFLQRANSYCTTNKIPILFVNDMFYFKGDNRYTEILSIQSNSQNNAQFFSNILPNDTENKVSNNAQSVVVLRRSGGAPIGKPKESSDTYIARKDYAVIIKNGKFEREGGFITQPDQYEFRASFYAYLLDAHIIPGFRNQAEAIKGWLQQDQLTNPKEGINYLTMYYPALIAVIEKQSENLIDALAQSLTDLFHDTFQEKSINGILYYSPDNPAFNEFSLDQKLTLYNSLIRNKYQLELFYVLDQKNNDYTQQDLDNFKGYTWNNKGEPYESSGIEKRTATSQPKTREKKAKIDGK
ncbi:hypothetical protein KSF_006050 [Reticulibacter mediterranei]|uniref:Metallo-beta-lactamase domain-containing protein n=1 Tax=Reticulibacter mediterranei TaxID=2778369 RepID=A0A8J3N0R3_9CHLR|nr:hypothetical protein [Reticulibacter mediterranei]GHO90557.1 hypothetical protein KSF_006050 [Reticulibacter mediterranei]